MKTLILNDTTRVKGHIGCATVMSNLWYLCKKYGFDIVESSTNQTIAKTKDFPELLEKIDVVIINGEGTLHHDKDKPFLLIKAAFMAKKMGKKVYLINALWQENEMLEKFCDVFDKVYCRDSYSLGEILSVYPEAKLVPDLSLYIQPDAKVSQKRNKTLVTDSVSLLITRKLLRFSRRKFYKFRAMGTRHIIRTYLSSPHHCGFPFPIWMRNTKTKDIASASRVITGRFHGMLLSIKHSVPFAVTQSNSHKVEAVLKDVGFDNFPLYLTKAELTQNTIDDINQRLDEFWTEENIKYLERYTQKAQSDIEEMFADLKNDFNKKD